MLPEKNTTLQWLAQLRLGAQMMMPCMDDTPCHLLFQTSSRGKERRKKFRYSLLYALPTQLSTYETVIITTIIIIIVIIIAVFYTTISPHSIHHMYLHFYHCHLRRTREKWLLDKRFLREKNIPYK